MALNMDDRDSVLNVNYENKQKAISYWFVNKIAYPIVWLPDEQYPQDQHENYLCESQNISCL